MKTVTGKILGMKQGIHCRKCFTKWDGLIAQVSMTVTYHLGYPPIPGRPQKIEKLKILFCFHMDFERNSFFIQLIFRY